MDYVINLNKTSDEKQKLILQNKQQLNEEIFIYNCLFHTSRAC